jgi:ubiquinone/menaquinone biosynthesis C-methylase UbiE
MVRVLHHIEKPEEYFKEAKRVFKKDATYIQEFANKVHIKAKIKALLKRDLSSFQKNLMSNRLERTWKAPRKKKE